MASRPAISSIAMALAGKTPSMDIPRPHHSAGTDNRLPHDQPDSRRAAMLPTPPGSLSPSFHPAGFKHRNNNNNHNHNPNSPSHNHHLLPDSPTSAPAHVDSDVDLLQTTTAPTEEEGSQPAPLVAESLHTLASLESAGAITPAMLAKYHLPEILLNHGPLAIRHIMSYLTTNVPGFSGIPPAKARRLVVSALEGKGSGGEGGGINGDVIFEKVGWGRWDAKRRGSKDPLRATPPSSVPSSSLPRGLASGRRDSVSYDYGSSLTAESVVLSHSEFGYGDADRMSLDGDRRAYCSSSEASDDDDLMDGDWDEADLTDEEDWARIGADALRARSFPHASNHDSQSRWRTQGSGGGPSYATLAKSAPGPIPIPGPDHSSSSFHAEANAEERAAVEALLKLGSM
ncbi:hypothetical protein VTO42DRAFT_83 [Malbranchea cinnamomea]